MLSKFHNKICKGYYNFKLYRFPHLKKCILKCKKFEFCPEVTAKILKRGIKIYEVPIPYYPRSIEQGKKVGWKDGLQVIWTLVKYWFIDKHSL